MLTYNENTNDKHVKRSSKTLDGKGTNNLSDSNHEVCNGSESGVDSRELDLKIGGERDNPEISRSDNNGYLIIDTNGIKRILIPDEALSSSSPSESTSNDFLQARKVKFVKSSASESASKDEHNDVSHESSTSIGDERKKIEISRSDNNDHLKTNTNANKNVLVPDGTSSPFYLSESSSNDFFQPRKATFAESPASKFASKNEESDVSRQSSIKSEPGNDFPVRASTSPTYSLNRGHMSMSPTVAPLVQMMDRSSEYDSYRIPSSVFAVNTNPMDWTNDSDESLFSIQIGNPSLARDHLFTALELRKSLELTKSGELNMFSPQPSPPIEDRDTFRRSVETKDSPTTEMSDEDFKLEGSLDKNKNDFKNSHPDISYNSRGIGVQSSALPIEKKQEAPLCRCSNCSWAFCCLSWPSCSICSWAFCCLSWPRCSCLKCSLALCCCWRASPVLPEVENHNSVKIYNPQVTSDSTSNCCNLCQCFSWLCCTCCSHTDSPRQQSYGKDSKKSSSSTSHCCSWFHCFFGSCCSWDICCCCCCCSETDSSRHQYLDKASEEIPSSTSSCFQCCSWSCCSPERNNYSDTDNPRHRSFDKTYEKTSSSTSNCCSWSLCLSSGKSSCSTSNCCSWFLCSSSGKSSCSCC